MKRFIPFLVLLAAAACSSAPEEETGRGEASVMGGLSARVFDTGADGLNVRAEPTTESAVVGGLRDGQTVTISCQIAGDVVEGNAVWDFIGDGYVADRFVWTGHTGFAPNVPRCGATSKQPEAKAASTSSSSSKSTDVDVEGPAVRSHVQTFADLACGSVNACAISTYEGHHPSADLALDIRVSSAYGVADNYAFGDRVAQFALDNQSRHRIWYVIYRQRINYGDGWEAMEDRGSITQNHYDHVHVSFYP